MSEPNTNTIDENKSINENPSSKSENKKKRNKQKKKSNNGAGAAAKSQSIVDGANQISPITTNESNDSIVGEDGGLAATDTELQNVKGLVEVLKKDPRFIPMLRAPKTPEEALQKSYKFWSTQPVPKLDEKIQANESIEPDKELSEIRAEPYALPDGFKWDTLNLNEPLVLTELYTLLNENYVEDDDAMFRFDYQPEFLKWALQPPGWRQEWHAGVRVVKSGLLVGFISAIPGHVKIYDKMEKIVEINFLCVHKKLRSKRVAPVLIREITRRVNLTGIFQAVYTAGVVLPKPVATCRYWHRSLNPKKLIEVRNS